MTLSYRHGTGFTIIELMISISVLALLLSIGVPAFTDIIRSNRVSAQTNDLVGGLNLARAEAAKRGLPVAVCAADAARNACAGVATANWTNGWLIFTDRTGDVGLYDGMDELLETSEAIGEGMTVTSNNAGFARFFPGSTPAPEVTFNVRPNACVQNNLRRVTVIRTGRINSARVPCA